MANVLIEHLNKQPKGVDQRNREMFEWLEKRDFYDYEVIFAFLLFSLKAQCHLLSDEI